MSSVLLLSYKDALRQSREYLRYRTAPAATQDRSHTVGRAERSGRTFLHLERPLAFASRLALARRCTSVAAALAGRAVKLAPRSVAANLAAGIAFRRSGDRPRALHRLQCAAEADDVRRLGNWELAKLLLELERSDTPEAYSSRRRERISALRLASGSVDPVIAQKARVALAEALHDSGHSSEALRIIGPVLEDAPNDLRALRVASLSMAAQNRIQEACAFYRQLIALDSRHPVTKSLRALDLFCTGEEREPSEAPGPASWLIAIGGGIGDILHCTPAIANIARHTKQRPDVLVAGDHPGAEFLVQNPEYVNRVWTLGRGVLQQAYRNVFVTHSFGPLRLAFNAEQVKNARDWQHFHAGGLHETLFNLEAAKALLGIPYDEADAAIYFAGNLERREPDTQLVGLHAGSKGGRWLSKRWPYFGELTRKLRSRGVRVASFGTPDEYVPGTENLTGGTIEEMCRALSGCTLFVSNDSGAMHLASALGIRAVAIFAPTDALTHMPLTETVAALTLQKDCSPCEVKNHAFFASGRCACVGEIPVEAAEGIILSLLSADEADRGIA